MTHRNTKSRAANDLLPYIIDKIQAQDVPSIAFGSGDAVFITGFNEFGYGTSIIKNNQAPRKPFNAINEWLAVNRAGVYPVPASNDPALVDQSDFVYMVEEDLYRLAIKKVVLWVNNFTIWGGSGIYPANQLKCRPALSKDVKDVLFDAADWSAQGFTSGNMVANPTAATEGFLLPGAAESLPLVSGSPSDQSLREAIVYLNQRGYQVGLACIPRFLNLSESEGEAWEIWRGLIGGTGYEWPGADDLARVVSFLTWYAEYSTMVQYYATMFAGLGVTPWTIYVGSEMRGCQTANARVREAYVDSVILLARQVRRIVGHHSLIVDAIDWSNLGYYSNFRFNVDQIASSYFFDRVGVDNYSPISDIHTNSRCELADGLNGGEGVDYYFASVAPDTKRLLVDSADPSDGLGKSTLTRTPMEPAYSGKLYGAYVAFAHADETAFDSPTPDPLPPAGTIRVLASPTGGLRIREDNTSLLGAQTMSDMVGTQAVVSELETIQQNVGPGIRPIPPLLKAYLPFNGDTDYAEFTFPSYSRAWKVAGVAVDETPSLTVGYQPQFYGAYINEDGNADFLAMAGMNATNVNYVFDIVFRFDGPSYQGAYATIAYHKGRIINRNAESTLPVFEMRVYTNPLGEQELQVDVYGWKGPFPGFQGLGVGVAFQPYSDTKCVLQLGHIYRAQLYVDAVQHEPHAIANVGELRVWDLSVGGDLIFNHAGEIGGPTSVPFPGSTVMIGRGFDPLSNANTRYFQGRVYYVGYYSKREDSFGSEFFMSDEPYFGTGMRRTSWQPTSRQIMFCELGYAKIHGSCVEPNVFPTTYIGETPLPSTFRDYPFWQTLRDYFPDNMKVSDIGGPFGSGMYADEVHQATCLSTAMEIYNNLTIDTPEGPMNPVNEKVIYNLDVRTRQTKMAPGDGAGATSLYFSDGPKLVLLAHELNGTLAVKQGRSGGPPATVPPIATGLPKGTSSASISSSVPPSASVSVATSAPVSQESSERGWFWNGTI